MTEPMSDTPTPEPLSAEQIAYYRNLELATWCQQPEGQIVELVEVVLCDPQERDMLCDSHELLRARLTEAERRIAMLEAALAYWKVCENCGTPLRGPGICSEAITEHEKELELMNEETLVRAEAAEQQIAALQAQAETLTAERDEARRLAANKERQA